jgi:molybdopterin-guanine dinucleotide biosynthesis protein A
VIVLLVSMTGCSLLMAPVQLASHLFQYLVGLFGDLAPLATTAAMFATEDATVDRVERDLVALAAADLPPLNAEGLARLAQTRGARALTLIDAHQLTPDQRRQAIIELARRGEVCAINGYDLTKDRELTAVLARAGTTLVPFASSADGQPR